MRLFETEEGDGEGEIRAGLKTMAQQQKGCKIDLDRQEVDLVLRMVKNNMYR